MNQQDKKLDSRVRILARRAGLTVCRSRRGLSIDNHGGYRLVDPYRKAIVAGEKFDLSANDIIAWCTE